MSRRSLALVANFHRERRIGRKTANFLRHIHGRLHDRGIDFNIEFVLDRPDEATVAEIERSSAGIPGSRIHLVDFANLGVSRTYGVKAARADVVCFTDGDDFFSLDWFERALDFFSRGPLRVVLHTQYMVGFDHEQFVRETTESTDPSFDPLSLAIDWYWSANLAVQTEVFASAPIEPYDHASGFGSEDWHWACNSLVAGIARVSLPGAVYYYRVKPDRFALGKVADVIHMASPLFEADRTPPPAAPSVDRPSVTPLSTEFFAQAREVEPFELGLSYLRSVEAGATEVRHYKPHTPPIVGATLRAVAASGFGDGSSIVFADSQRLAGGLEMASSLCSAIVGGESSRRLYVVEGDQQPCRSRPDGYEIHLGDLRSAGLYNEQIDRLLARFFIQNKELTVLNLLSPRTGSRALAYSRATRWSVRRWINLVMEYGFDALSQAYDELDQFADAGVDSEDLAVFGQTAAEAWEARGIRLGHSAALEAAYVGGSLGALPIQPSTESRTAARRTAACPPPEGVVIVRLRAEEADAGGDDGAVGPWLTVDARFGDPAARVDEFIFTGGDAFLGEYIGSTPAARPPGLRIPALTVIRQEKSAAFYFTPAVGSMNVDLSAGRVPSDLAWAGAIGIDGPTVRELLASHSERLSLPALMAASLARAREAGVAGISLFAANSVVSSVPEDIGFLGGPRLMRGLSRHLARRSGHG